MSNEMPKRHWSYERLTPEERRALAKRAGIISQARGNGHSWNSETAAAAGRLGGRERWRRARERKNDVHE
jgi:hypothetical protein